MNHSDSNKTVQILYASATGTAEDLADQLHELFLLNQQQHRHQPSNTITTSCNSLDAYDLHKLATPGTTFVFVVSTCGDGDHPRAMHALWCILRQASLPRDLLASMRFAVLGLGDRAYVKFNAAARRLYARLTQLGATPLVPLNESLADEQADGGVESLFVPWAKQLFSVLDVQLDMDKVCKQVIDDQYLPKIEYVDSDNTEKDEDEDTHIDIDKWRKHQVKVSIHLQSQQQQQKQQSHNKSKLTNYIKVVNSKTLTNPKYLTDDRQVRHVTFNVSNTSCQSYTPGDVLHLLPRNRSSAVDAFFQLFPDMHLQQHQHVHVEPSSQLNIRTPCTIRDLVSAHFDLWATPRRRFFQRLAHYCADATERAKLEELGSVEPDNVESLIQYAFREKRTVLMVFRDFPSARPPLHVLLYIMPVIRTRAFSIASCNDDYTSVDVCVAMVQYKTPLRFIRQGLCSSFVSRLHVNDIVPAFIERASALDFKYDRPAILIATGTGIAPMRAFLKQLQKIKTKHAKQVKRLLVFGCRHERGDFLYADELKQLIQQNVLSEMVTAFSRADGEDSQSLRGKVYVQHRLMEENVKKQVWDIINGNSEEEREQEKGYVYVAGAAGDMPKEVRQALVDICNEFMNGDGDEDEDEDDKVRGEKYVRRMEIDGRLQMECW